jgi:hypothetical protein
MEEIIPHELDKKSIVINSLTNFSTQSTYHFFQTRQRISFLLFHLPWRRNKKKKPYSNSTEMVNPWVYFDIVGTHISFFSFDRFQIHLAYSISH